MIYDFFNISSETEATWDLTSLTTVQSNNDNVQASDTKCAEVLSAVTDRATDNMCDSLYKMQIEKSEELKYSLPVYTQEATLVNEKYDYHMESHFSKREIEMRTDLQKELRAKERRKEKAKQMPRTTLRQGVVYVGSRKANVHVEIRAHSIMFQAREAKGRGDLVHLLQRAHRTEIRKVTGRMLLMEVQKKLAGKSPPGKANLTRKLSKRTFLQLLASPWMYKIQISKWMQIRRQVCIQTRR